MASDDDNTPTERRIFRAGIGLNEAVILVASSQVGIREEGGANQGEHVKKYLASVGLGPGYPWCAAFVYWVFNQAVSQFSIRNPCPKTAKALGIWMHAPSTARILLSDEDASERIRPGCVFVEDHEIDSDAPILEHHGHCGILEGIDYANGFRLSIDGNTDVKGNREGDGVYRRTRALDDPKLLGFVDLEAVERLVA